MKVSYGIYLPCVLIKVIGGFLITLKAESQNFLDLSLSIKLGFKSKDLG